MENGQGIEKLSKELILKLIFSALPPIFWVVFLWNFWDKGPYAMGFNATIFGLMFLGLFVWALYKNNFYCKHDLLWIGPLVLIFLSYSLYDNPFIKITSLLIVPILFALFYIQAHSPDKKNKMWNFEFVLQGLIRFFSFITKIWHSAKLYLQLIIPAGKDKNVFVRIVGGLILFLIISFTVFIPLLSSADPVFAGTVQVVYDWFLKIFSSVIIYKIIMASVLTILFFSVLTAWSRQFVYTENETYKKIDSIISGIVLGGILCLYLLFLGVQINRLWVGDLPFDFKATEDLVKSGFWQLLFLSIINILIYFFTYRKTNNLVQKILTVFTIASLFLLFSAGYRMILYTTYYGFSYEKFFASYTVIYCAILFVWLVIKLFAKQRANILKFLIMLFLWMYALVAIFPVEQFIIRSNVALSNIKDSRINLYELTMLSPDALTSVEKYAKQGVIKEVIILTPEEQNDQVSIDFGWDLWMEQQQKLIADKTWYEKNINNIVYLIKDN